MKVDIFDKYKNITELRNGIDGKIYITLDFEGMPQFKRTIGSMFMEFNNEEEADKYLSENMHKIEIDLYKAELYECYKHMENQRIELFVFNEKDKKGIK